MHALELPHVVYLLVLVSQLKVNVQVDLLNYLVVCKWYISVLYRVSTSLDFRAELKRHQYQEISLRWNSEWAIIITSGCQVRSYLFLRED